MHLHQQYQGHGDHQLVGYRVEEGAERRALLQATGQVTVQPVSGRGDGEDTARCDIAPVIRNIEQQNEDRNEQDAKNGKQIWNIHRHNWLQSEQAFYSLCRLA
ncbi:hypothetical protein D3C78_479310 [compost metagenome]